MFLVDAEMEVYVVLDSFSSNCQIPNWLFVTEKSIKTSDIPGSNDAVKKMTPDSNFSVFLSLSAKFSPKGGKITTKNFKFIFYFLSHPTGGKFYFPIAVAKVLGLHLIWPNLGH